MDGEYVIWYTCGCVWEIPQDEDPFGYCPDHIYGEFIDGYSLEEYEKMK